ncbi:PQQ-dependent sugar dehydrogenase [Roseobacter denitrificans]|uniref:Glucose dehydrogenase, putative n=1 Tax=Roseobacter denitrificans (strain ATCC 33942 / OCh 114) TaxID=375451 RepID=Q166B2_ROSDO|nr:PQQ-dependent sugar dehydrogenase [Roseobacter denitrificans]ABG32181.1 glucose dehydrogenase, putative [Roseobacter denitrificans OCh 114]AVL51679.1 PQQ-dependent sugar dehydrogenase [Roseobacter denitrificans]SFF78342.1 Glucose/arabinose dehydrogenase, beta-propeller fold [Roseobacter denitrificans OCh 114]
MLRLLYMSALFVFVLAVSPATGRADIVFTPVVTGLDTPWAIAHLPDGQVLITEKDGRVLLWSAGTLREVEGAPQVVDRGQGGLMDVTVARDFARSRTVFLSYSKRQRGGAGTALAAATLSQDGRRLEDLRDIFVMAPGSSGGRHFGSRIVENTDGTLFLAIGDRGDRPSAQDRENHAGSVIRINRDGSIPSDNPFVNTPGVQPEIWSFGHRNPQGAGLDAQGRLWTAEHGARGGDEINLVRKGANYGWPVISYGRHYTGGKIGEGTARAGMEQPASYWDPSIAPSGLLVYQGDMFPDWRGHMFVGSLKDDYIARLTISGETTREVERIQNEATTRVRDVADAADGSIWFISVGNGAIYRISD